MTQFGRQGALLDLQLNSAFGGINLSNKLPGKIFQVKERLNRTVNRHRWIDVKASR